MAYFFIFILSILTLNAADYSIVFIHLGKTIPSYTETALEQARLFNKNCPIILVAEKNAISNLSQNTSSLNITYISSESLNQTKHHKQFIKQSTLQEGFWRYTSERFLYLDDLMSQYHLENVFHLENDNMLYVNLEELLPLFNHHYKGIAATFDNDDRCIPGFIFISNEKIMNHLGKYFANHALRGYNDMQLIAKFKNESTGIDYLPITTQEYVNENPLVSPSGHKAKNKNKFSEHITSFQSIFDAAALGQYLGGIDPRHSPLSIGFINESCVFNPSLLSYEWHIDEQGRGIPYAIYKNGRYRINNLHIHSKNLKSFRSTSTENIYFTTSSKRNPS